MSKSLFTLSERWRKYGTEEFVQVNRKSIIPRKNATNSKCETYNFNFEIEGPFQTVEFTFEVVGAHFRTAHFTF